MPLYRVRRFDGHKGDEGERRVEAENEKEVAEQVCGVLLVDRGHPIQLRAQVSPVEMRSAKKRMFYKPADALAAEQLGTRALRLRR